MTNLHVSKYQLTLFPSPSARYRAVIQCIDTRSGIRLKAHFLPEHQGLARPEWEDERTLNAFFHAGEYEHVVDLLRNESPVVFFAHGDSKDWHFGSGAEDVGDGERAGAD